METCMFDSTEVESFEDGERAGLTIHPVTYGTRWNGWAQPVVTAAEFARFIAAWRANDPNGVWGAVAERDTETGRKLVHVYNASSVPESLTDADLFELGWDNEGESYEAGEGGLYLLSGLTFLTESDWARMELR